MRNPAVQCLQAIMKGMVIYMEYLRELNMISIIVRAVLALVIGGSIGINRESKKQPAGFRTYMLVSVGAVLVMMTNQYISEYYNTGDPSRLGAQVISGIGFLGAGTIIVTKNNHVRGLTTAAGLWASACIGLAIGIGFYEGAIVIGIVIMMIMTILKKIEKLIIIKSKVIKLYINFKSRKYVNGFINFTKKNKIKIYDIHIEKESVSNIEENDIIVITTLKSPKTIVHKEFLNKFRRLEGVINVEEI